MDIDKWSTWINVISDIEYQVAKEKLGKLESLDLFARYLNQILEDHCRS